jgi:tRNA (cmo5U34)-methyltransferase
MTSDVVNLWSDPAHAVDYLNRRPTVPWRETGYAHLLEFVPAAPKRVLDLGTGDGLVAAQILEARPDVEVVACDFSAEMLTRARDRFAGTGQVTVVEHDLDDPLPASWGTFDAVVSAFAIHHVVDARKQALYGEVFDCLEPGGVFCNLEHVASATDRLHEEFLRVIDAEEDPSNKLVAVETQLTWFRDLGFDDVDCHYKWREIALLVGSKPA